MKTALIICITLVVGAAIVFSGRDRMIRQLRDDNTILTGKIDESRPSPATDIPAAARANNHVTGSDEKEELQRLRDEVLTLRRQLDEATNNSAGALVPEESWAFAGYTTPQATVESLFWARKQFDVNAFLASHVPEEQNRIRNGYANRSDAEFAVVMSNQWHRARIDKITGFSIASICPVYGKADELNVFVNAEGVGQHLIRVKKVGDEWKVQN
jgi:hypothetical protein